MNTKKQIKKSPNFIIPQLFLYNFAKIKSIISFWILLFLSLVLFVSAPFLLIYFSKNDSNVLLQNFSYIFLIFENIIFVIFILLLLSKIFSNELEDGSYLLILSRPFSRTSIFLVKLLSVWFFSVLFLLIIFSISILFGYIANVIYHTSLFLTYFEIIIHFFLYSLAILLFASSGILLASSFLSSNSVLLIVIIFCSLFLAGGMPYALIASLEKPLYVENIDGGDLSLNETKTAILFNEKMISKKNSNFKYKFLTSELYNFINSLSPKEIKIVKSPTIISDYSTYTQFYKDFYAFLNKNNLLSSDQNYFSVNLGPEINVVSWGSSFNDGVLDNKKMSSATPDSEVVLRFSGDVTLTYDKSKPPLKTMDEIKNDIENNNASQIEIELFNSFKENYLDMLQKNLNDWYGTKNYLNDFYYPLQSNDKDMNQNENYFKITNWPTNNDKSSYPINFLAFYQEYNQGNNRAYNLTFKNGSVKTLLNNFFQNNPLNAFLGNFMQLIAIQDTSISNLTNMIMKPSGEKWKKYNSLNLVYNSLNKINLLEHWNQLWTGFFAPQNQIFFDFYHDNLEFDKYHNELMSYMDYPIALNNSNLISLDINNYINLTTLLIAYVGLSIIMIISSGVIFKFKTIQ